MLDIQRDLGMISEISAYERELSRSDLHVWSGCTLTPAE